MGDDAPLRGHNISGKKLEQLFIWYEQGSRTSECDGVEDLYDEWEAFDPNCVERFGGYGGYGGLGAYGGYGQQFGGYGGFGMLWATTPDTASSSVATCSTRPPSRSPQPLPVDGAAPAPATPTFKFQQQQYYGGYPQMNFGGYGGYRQQQMYYGR